jgi:lipid-binding SYLF domain-containing protein
MKKKLCGALVLIMAGLTAGVHADAERIKDAALVLTEMAGSADNEIPQSLLAKAKCVVVIPGVKKAALGIGGQFGRGYISCRTANPAGWSAPGAVHIEGASFGLQIGGSETDVLMTVMNDRGVERLLSNKFTLGADASLAAGPVGRQASAQTDATMRAEMLAWSRSRGVFAGIALQGSTLREDDSENEWLYGAKISNREIVTGGKGAPAAAEPLMAALRKY